MESTGPLPDNLGELLGALITLVTAIIAAFKRGKKVGQRSAGNGH